MFLAKNRRVRGARNARIATVRALMIGVNAFHRYRQGGWGGGGPPRNVKLPPCISAVSFFPHRAFSDKVA